MIELTFKGSTLNEIHEAIIKEAEGLNGSPKVLANTSKEQAASTATTSEDKTTSTDTKTFDEVEYSGENTTRNLWILLTDGRVIEIKAGGALPVDEQREKNITKKLYNEIAEEEPERVVKSIAEVIDDEPKGKNKKKAKDVEPEETDDEGEDETENEEGDGDDDSDMDRAKELVAEAKEIAGGKAFVKELLEDYDVKRVTKIEDEDDLADFIEDVGEFIEENED